MRGRAGVHKGEGGDWGPEVLPRYFEGTASSGFEGRYVLARANNKKKES